MGTKELGDKVRQLMSDPKISVAVLFLAIIGRAIQLLYLFNIRSDRALQLRAADNFLKGHGISTDQVFAHELSTTVYEPLIKWPPGYSILVAPFYALFNSNYIAAGLTLDILAAITLFVYARKVLFELEIPVYLINLFTLVIGFFIYEFYFIVSSDSIVTTVFVVLLYYTLRFLKCKLSWQRASVILGVLLLVLTSLKYSFILTLFVIPLFLLVKGWADHEAPLKKVGVFSLLIVAVGLTSILLYQKSVSGSAAYVTNADSGFFPENLLSAFPLLSEAFLKPNTIGQLFGLQTGIGSVVFSLLQLFHVVLGIIILVYMARRIRKQGFRKLSVTDSFFYLAFFVSLAIFGLLLTLSLRIAKDTENWTFIQEGRYYGVASVLVHLAVFVFFQKCRFRLFPQGRAILFGLLFLLFIEGCRGIFFTFNRIRYFGREEFSWQYEDRLQKYADAILTRAKKKYSVDKAAVTGSSSYYNHRIYLYSHVPIMHAAEKINDLSSLNTKEPVVLLVMIYELHKPRFLPFLQSRGGEEIGNFDGHSFYTVYVTPR